jgi:putative membrane protein
VVAGTRALRGFVTVRGTWVVRRDRARGPLLAAATLSLSGLLGFVVMNARPPLAELIAGLGQDVLFPLLSGLFAFPALLSAMSSAPVPPQSQAADEATDLRPALTGTLAGFLAGWMPGITSTIGTVIGTAFTRRPEDEEQGTKSYIRMLSAVGTSSVVFSMMALALEGEGRTGVMLSLKEALGDEVGALSSLPGVPMALLLIAVLVASAAGYRLALSSGALLARKAAGRDLRRVNLVVLALLCALILLFNGLSGLVVAAVAALVGSLPPLLGVRRVHLTGCLLLPLLLFYFGLEEELAGLIWGASVSP